VVSSQSAGADAWAGRGREGNSHEWRQCFREGVIRHGNPQLSDQDLDKAALRYQATIPPEYRILEPQHLEMLSTLLQAQE
jgi:hypothetical protein